MNYEVFSNESGVAHQGGLRAAHVRMDVAEARSLASDLYGLEVQAARLETEKDDTFTLSGSDRRQFIMKVANPAEGTAEVELQVAMLEHLAARDPTPPVPAVIRTTDGRALAPVTDRAGQVRLTRLLSHIDGTPMDRTPSSALQRRRVGAALARLRVALADFDHPGAERVLAWDVRHLSDLAPELHVIPNLGHRAQVEQVLARFADIEPAIDGLRRQVLHNDFSKSNLIADHNDPDRLVGVIDFGDSVRTAIAIDVSTALLNQLPRDLGDDLDVDMFADGRDLLAGYLALAELTDEELSLVPHLVMARVAARAIISYGRAALFPENAAYIMRNSDQGWAQLAWFLARSPEQVSAILRDVPRLHAADLEEVPK